jgi:hypothetical protein
MEITHKKLICVERHGAGQRLRRSVGQGRLVEDKTERGCSKLLDRSWDGDCDKPKTFGRLSHHHISSFFSDLSHQVFDALFSSPGCLRGLGGF